MQIMKTITKTQYYQLLGLIFLANRAIKEIDNIVSAALEITGEKDDKGRPETLGHTNDVIWHARKLDDALDIMKIKVGK